jgi:hypothetical protein
MAAFIRTMQMMSDTHLFVFVEGDNNDPYFYGQLCSKVLSETGVSYKIYTSKSIPGSSTGKTALIGLFEYLKENSLLLNELHGKKTGILFFLDKDLDDILNKQIDSEHVTYTYYYEVENHIIEHGDLKEGCAAAASMDPQEIDRCIGNQAEWLRQAAQKWKEWVKFCVFSRLSKSERSLNYSRPSQFNVPRTGDVDMIQYEEKLSLLRSESKLSADEFLVEFNRISRIVEDLYQEGKHGNIFKGKWYSYFLADQIRQVAETTPGYVDGIEQQIIRHVANTLDFNAAWTDYFKRAPRRMVDKLSSTGLENDTHSNE